MGREEGDRDLADTPVGELADEPVELGIGHGRNCPATP